VIIVGGEGALLLVVLLFFAMFVLLPVLFFRSARRLAEVPDVAGWEPLPAPTYGEGWQVPDAPALPEVSPADVESLRARLGHDVRTLEPGEDPVARQALADASERLSTCSTLLERAGSQAQLRTAWLAAAEGLHASRLVRSRLGLDPGPEVPLPPTGPVLQQPTRVSVGGREHVGSPSYEPGRPHWFPGGAYDGRQVPAGWYDAPFWPAAVVLGGLGGLALGSLAAGAVFGDGWGDGGWVDDGWGDGLGGGYDGGFGGFGGGGGWGQSGGGGGWGDGGWGDGGGDWGGGDW
jgi:hypothetical protein